MFEQLLGNQHLYSVAMPITVSTVIIIHVYIYTYLSCFIGPRVEHHGDECHVAVATTLTQLIVHYTCQYRSKISRVT